MPLLYLLVMVLIQWLVVQLPHIQAEYDTTAFLWGNLQIIIMLYVYNLIKKYIRI